MALEQHNLLRIIIPSLYLATTLLVYWKLIPRLPSAAKTLATALMLAQVAVLVLAVELDTSSSYARKLVHINGERNLAAGLATLQLALVAGFALVIARLSRAAPRWQRCGYIGLSLLFLYLAGDELYSRHEGIPHWTLYYAGAGLGVVALTLLIARRSPRRTWIWHGCFLGGLAMGAAGAMLLEHLRAPELCRLWRLFYIDRCLLKYIEEAMEYLGIWLALVAMMGLLADAAPLSKRSRRALHLLFPLLALALITRIGDPDPGHIEYNTGAEAAALIFESGVVARAYRTELDLAADRVKATLWLSAPPFTYDGLGYSLQLIDQATGELLASHDQPVSVVAGSVLGPGYAPIFRQRTDLHLPQEAPANRAYWIALAIWREADVGYVNQAVLSSDRQLLSDRLAVLAEFALPGAPKTFSARPRARFETGFAFAAELPESARPGDTLALRMIWRAEEAGERDYTQFLHFQHDESGELWAFDQQPLGARLPTRLWYGGLAESEDWQVALPPDMRPGDYRVYSGLYRASDLSRLPAFDAAGVPFPDARAPLGVVAIEAA